MKVIVQIIGFENAARLSSIFDRLPQNLEPSDIVEFQVIDDRTQQTPEFLQRRRDVHITAASGATGDDSAIVDQALSLGADIIVRTDARRPAVADSIPDLLAPVMSGAAQIALGSVAPPSISSTAPDSAGAGSRVVKPLLTVVKGENAAPAWNGFSACTREAALRLPIPSKRSGVAETVIQAQKLGFDVAWIQMLGQLNLFGAPEAAQRETVHRPAAGSILRRSLIHEPFIAFSLAGCAFIIPALVFIGRFFVNYFSGGGSGHIQSLIISGSMLVIGALLFGLGVLGDLLSVNRQLMHEILYRVRTLQLHNKVEDSFQETVARWRRSSK